VSEAQDMYDRLKKVNEARGYFFNEKSPDLTTQLIEGLLFNKQRYGYMCCPCRLGSGNREADKDIICPCDYREQDVKEYGSCYCNLYVSQEWNDGVIAHVTVPERRPPEKSLGGWPGADA
jgi:ferredoxin-thioredoxin reductase catalytic subunit